MATLKFWQDKDKTQQVYPDINPDGNYPGITVGLANNLTSPDGVTDTDEWNYRSTAGEQDVSEGYAELQTLKGNMTSTTIPESLHYNLLATGIKSVEITQNTFKTKCGNKSDTYDFIYTPIISYNSELVYSLDKTTFANYAQLKTGDYTFTYTAVIAQVDTGQIISSFNKNTFIAKVQEKPETYTFNYRESNWQLNGENVTMSEYGITTKGTEQDGASIIIYYTSNSWYKDDNAVSLNNYGITTTGSEKVDSTITINYTANQWQLKGEEVTLSQYGITPSGTAAINDDIQVVFVAEQIGVIVVAHPTGLYSVGMNQFDKNGDKIFTGFTINTVGKITALNNSYVIYFKCLGGNTYTISDSTASSIVRAGYCENLPTQSSTTTVLSAVTNASSGQSCTNNTTMSHFTPSKDGYLCVATTDIENLCCHLTWSGYNDGVYEAYWDYTLNISYRDAQNKEVSTYGLAKIDSTYYDEIDYVNHRYIKRVARVEYSAENMATVQGYKKPMLYDSDWIYYGIDDEVHQMEDISSAYRVSDFGTEQFVGTDLELGATVQYQDNLKDKLRRSVEVLDNKKKTVSSTSTDDDYPTAKAVWNLNYNVLKMLGLHVDTFSTSKTYAVGAYVVRENKLWKCKTAVTSAGAWKAANWEESYLFKAD